MFSIARRLNAAQVAVAGGQKLTTQELTRAEKSARDAYQALAKGGPRDLQRWRVLYLSGCVAGLPN